MIKVYEYQLVGYRDHMIAGLVIFVILILCMMLGAGGQVNENAKQGLLLAKQIPTTRSGTGWACLSILSTFIIVIILFSLASIAMFGR